MFTAKTSKIGLQITADIRARLPPHLSRKATRLAIARFFDRKTVFMKYCQAFVVLPGGYGTMDELFEALPLVATDKITRFPVVLAGSAC